MHTLEDEGVGRQEAVKQAVDEGHVESNQEDHRFCGQQPQRTRKVLGDQFLEINFDLLLLGVNAPILCPTSQLGGFRNQDDGRVGLLDDEKYQEARRDTHDTWEVKIPPPPEIGSLDESTDEGAKHRTHENRGCEDDNGGSSLGIVKHVRKRSRHNSERTRSEEAGEKPTEHKCLYVERCGCSEIE